MNEEWDQRAPLGWDTKNPKPVAKVVNFLLSDLSEVVTGEIIHADGGVHSIGGSMLPKQLGFRKNKYSIMTAKTKRI